MSEIERDFVLVSEMSDFKACFLQLLGLTGTSNETLAAFVDYIDTFGEENIQQEARLIYCLKKDNKRTKWTKKTKKAISWYYRATEFLKWVPVPVPFEVPNLENFIAPVEKFVSLIEHEPGTETESH